jgi:hypothetical protein
MHLEQLIKKCGNRLQTLGREGDWWTATAVPDVSHPFTSTIAETPQKALQLLLDDLEQNDVDASNTRPSPCLLQTAGGAARRNGA